jgi:hypothetical protein
MKSFGSKKFKLHAGFKKCPFGNFSDRAGMAVPSRISRWNSKIIFALGFYEFLAGKTRNGLFF